jgi:hypothetical protein
VVRNIGRHTTMMRDEVNIQHIREEREVQAKSLAHFEYEADFRQSQKFQNLKNLICPQAVDDRLDWLLNRSLSGSAGWLVSDPVFLKWLDVSDSATRLLWLHGIPGAGKTFLSAQAIEEARTRQRTLFVFIRHDYPASTTARWIIQSLLVQLAMASKDVQSVLLQEDERALLGSTKHVSELLKKCLLSAGPAYLIIDGLDEMESLERGMLLKLILDLEVCLETKILVSSRPEDDISNVLQSKATAIRVDKRNSQIIQAYIDQRARDWIRRADFDRKATEQIQILLAPVAAAANGRTPLAAFPMFPSLADVSI